jgi:hypothetical protein
MSPLQPDLDLTLVWKKKFLKRIQIAPWMTVCLSQGREGLLMSVAVLSVERDTC